MKFCNAHTVQLSDTHGIRSMKTLKQRWPKKRFEEELRSPDGGGLWLALHQASGLDWSETREDQPVYSNYEWVGVTTTQSARELASFFHQRTRRLRRSVIRMRTSRPTSFRRLWQQSLNYCPQLVGCFEIIDIFRFCVIIFTQDATSLELVFRSSISHVVFSPVHWALKKIYSMRSATLFSKEVSS